MRRTLGMLLIMLIGVIAGAEEPEAVAREAALAAVRGDADAFQRLGNEQVKAAMTETMISTVAAQLKAQFGEFRKEVGVTPSTAMAQSIFLVDLEFERAIVKLTVAVDQDGLVSGLRVTGADPKKLWEAPPYANADAFTEEEATIGTEEFPLGATLSLPRSESPVPGVVLVHGSGPHDRDESIGPNKPFKDLAWGLASKGIAVLRYEKRTKAHAQRIPVESVTLESEVIEDAVLAAAFLRTRPEVDRARVFVVGHSLGGLALPFIAERDSKLAGVISIAGPSRPILDVLVEQIEYISRSRGDNAGETDDEVGRIRALAKRARAGESMDDRILGVPLSYWMELERADPAGRAAKLEMPILIIQGGRDYQVTMDNYELWGEALSGMDHGSLKVFENLNHLMIPGEGPSTPEEYQEEGHVDVAVVDAIVEWIEGRGEASK